MTTPNRAKIAFLVRTALTARKQDASNSTEPGRLRLVNAGSPPSPLTQHASTRRLGLRRPVRARLAQREGQHDVFGHQLESCSNSGTNRVGEFGHRLRIVEATPVARSAMATALRMCGLFPWAIAAEMQGMTLALVRSTRIPPGAGDIFQTAEECLNLRGFAIPGDRDPPGVTAMRSRVRRFAHLLERIGLAMAGAASGLFVAAHVGSSIAWLTSPGFVLTMIITGAVGVYL